MRISPIIDGRAHVVLGKHRVRHLGKWDFTCYSGNGRVLCSSKQGYNNRLDALVAAGEAHPGLPIYSSDGLLVQGQMPHGE